MDQNHCRMDSRPSLSMLQLHLLVMFLAGVIMSSWVWTSSTVDTWRRCVGRALNNKEEGPVRLKKHKVIAQAFAKRKTFNKAGRLSLSFHSTHEDPVGLNFDMNSAASRDLSSTWAAALPKLMTRRGALIGVATGSNSSQQHNSIDSEISYSVRRVSVESRRHSLDSQVSVQIAEVTATRKAAATPMPTAAAAAAATSGGRGKKLRNRRHRREFGCGRNHRVGPVFVRRGSTTSQESQLGAQILSALTLANTNIPSFIPNLKKRRTGNAGLDSSDVSLPFGLQVKSLDVTDEEQNSNEKIPGPDKIFDGILCGEANEMELADVNRIEGDGSDKSVAENEMTAGMSVDLVLEQCDSRRDNVSVSDGRNAGDCYRKPSTELTCQSKTIDNSGHGTRTTETKKVKNDYGDFRNGNIPDEVKLYLTEDSDDEPPHKPSFIPSVAAAGVSDGSTSFCPELSRLAILSSHSGVSVGSAHSFGTGKIRMITVAPCKQTISDDKKSAKVCDVETQTSLSVGGIDMQETNTMHSALLPLKVCTSQSTQVSPPLSRSSLPPPRPQRHIEKSQSAHINDMSGNVSSSTTIRGLNYSYNAQQLVKELAANSQVGPPVRPERRKSGQGKDIARSKSADDRSIELQWRQVLL